MNERILIIMQNFNKINVEYYKGKERSVEFNDIYKIVHAKVERLY